MEQGVSEAWHASDLLQSVVEEGPGVAKCSIQRSPGFLDVLACFGHVLEGPARESFSQLISLIGPGYPVAFGSFNELVLEKGEVFKLEACKAG